jgi:hypothetical protein
MLALGLPAPAFAGAIESSFAPLTWWLLAAVGLVAVIIAALTVGRSATSEADPGVGDAAQPAGHDAGAPDRHSSASPPAARREPSTLFDGPVTLPAAIRTRRPAVPAGAAPLAPAPEPLPPPTLPGPQEQEPPGLPALVATTGPLIAAAPLAAPSNDEAVLDDEAQARAQRESSQLFLALHHVDLSIDVLRRHLDGERRPMPAAWVMLLDLCRTHGREAAFRDIAAQFHARFNVCAPSWDTYPPPRDEPGLEAYPRIVRDLTQTWGTHECRRLLDRLLYDTRSGGRRGFTMNAYNDLIALRRAAGDVLDTIEQDFAEETKVRDAYARVAADESLASLPMEPVGASPLVRDLESQLDADLREPGEAKSALEREHPAFADALSASGATRRSPVGCATCSRAAPGAARRCRPRRRTTWISCAPWPGAWRRRITSRWRWNDAVLRRPRRGLTRVKPSTGASCAVRRSRP